MPERTKSFIQMPRMIYNMPRSALLNNHWRALCAALVIVLILCTGFQSSAQQRRRRGKAAKPAQTQTDSNNNSATATPTPQKPQKKNLAALRGSDSPQGGRATITSDVPLNDYEAYRSGNRYYVVIPQANAPGAPGGLRGRGYDDVQVHKRGNDTVLSFRLKPGTTAHVNQKFNRLEVVFNTPGDAATDSPSGTAGSQTANGNTNTSRPSTGTPSGTATPSGTTTVAGANANNAASGTTTSATSTGAVAVSPTPTGSPATALLPSVTPGLGPTVESSTAAASPTPPADQVAQSQPAPSVPTAVTTTTPAASSGASLGTILKNNWLLVLIAALLLISIALVAMTRSRSGRDATKTRPIEDKETPALEEGKIARAEAGRLEEASMAGAVAAVVQPTDRAAAIEPDTMLDETDTLEAEPVEAVNIERVRLEIKHILTGQEYDESVIDAPVKETRQLIESELLFALSKRNTERRERALNAFTRHGYLDDATRDLRTADVPAERAAAARKLGLTRDTVATPHLVAALEDSAPEVRRAAIEALTELGDPAAVAPLESLLDREEDRKVPHALVQRAIKASVAGTVGQKETPATQVAEPVEEAATVEAQPAVAEDVTPPVAETEASSSLAESANLADEASTPSVIAASLVSEPASPVEEIQDQRAEAEPAIEAEPSSLQDAVTAPAAVEATTEASMPAPAALESAVVEGAVTAAASAAERQRAKADAERIHAEQERLRLEEEARRREEEEERQRVEAEAQRRREEAEAERRRAEEERLRAEEERARAEEESRRRAEEEKKRVEEEARLKAAEEERLRAEEARRQRAEERERRRAEEERARLEVQERERAEADAARRRAEEAALRLAEMRRRAEEEARQREEAEAARLLKEEEARRAQEEAERERLEMEEAAARQREEEELERQRAAEARRREEEEERQRVEAEAQRRREEAEAERRRAEEERLRAEEETRRHAEEERRRVAEEERQRAEAEAARIQFEQEAAERRRREEAEAATSAKIDEIESVSTEDAVAPAVQPELFEPTLAAEPESIGSSQETSAEIVERKASDWFAVDFNEPEVLPVEPTPVSASATAEAAITEYEGAEEAASPVREIEESQAVTDVKEIEIAPAGRGGSSAFDADDFASVPGGILRRLSSEVASERAAAVTDLVRIGGDDAFREISAAFDDPAQLVRDAAARALYDLHDDHASSFTRALRESPADRRRRIGNALASSGLANEAIGHLMGESREKTYDAFSLLFLMSKAGEVQPLMRAIEDHPNSEVRLAVVKLLALSGQQDILPAFRRLAVRGSLPTEVRSAVMEAIYQISSQSSTDTTHVA